MDTEKSNLANNNFDKLMRFRSGKGRFVSYLSGMLILTSGLFIGYAINGVVDYNKSMIVESTDIPLHIYGLLSISINIGIMCLLMMIVWFSVSLFMLPHDDKTLMIKKMIGMQNQIDLLLHAQQVAEKDAASRRPLA